MIDSFSGRWAFLSNFYPVEIKHRGIEYPSVEHYYVSEKINTDQYINGIFYPLSDVKEIISKIKDPGEVKRFGRKLTLRKDWDDVRLKVMEWGLREKFKNEELKKLLLQTNDEELIEGNWWHDNFFGSCSCEKCKNKGENHLGRLLMKIRSEIQNSDKRPSLEDILFPKNK